MNYILLKNIIESTIENYVCQSCNLKMNEGAFSVSGVGEKILNLEAMCPNCHLHAHIHVEVGDVQKALANTDEGKALLKKIMTINENAIKDEDISNIEKGLSDANSVEDLLK